MNEDVIQKLEEVVETLRNQTDSLDEWNGLRRSRYSTKVPDRYIVRWGWGDNRSYFSTYDEARNWIMEDMKTYNKENAIPEYAIDHETTQTIEFVLPRKKKCDGVLFGANRAPDDEYKGVTEVWV